MPHTPEFNVRRRAFYAEGRANGLPGRLAGHIYSERTKATRIAEFEDAPVSKVRREISPAERQLLYERRTGHLPVSPYHNYYPAYTKVKVYGHNEDGERRVKFYTLVHDQDRVPTNREVKERLDRLLQRGPQSDSEYITVDSFTIGETLIVPDQTQAPSIEFAPDERGRARIPTRGGRPLRIGDFTGGPQG